MRERLCSYVSARLLAWVSQPACGCQRTRAGVAACAHPCESAAHRRAPCVRASTRGRVRACRRGCASAAQPQALRRRHGGCAVEQPMVRARWPDATALAMGWTTALEMRSVCEGIVRDRLNGRLYMSGRAGWACGLQQAAIRGRRWRATKVCRIGMQMCAYDPAVETTEHIFCWSATDWAMGSFEWCGWHE
eukprot:1443948-Pleurochrysis_carterae.AAC.12